MNASTFELTPQFEAHQLMNAEHRYLFNVVFSPIDLFRMLANNRAVPAKERPSAVQELAHGRLALGPFVADVSY